MGETATPVSPSATHILRGRGVTRIVIGGLTTDYCVKDTALDGMDTGFAVLVLTDAIAAVDLEAGDGARAIDEMVEAGAVMAAANRG